MMILYDILVGGAITILKNMSQWEGWHPIYEMDNEIHVWNHQPGMSYVQYDLCIYRLSVYLSGYVSCSMFTNVVLHS